VQNSRNLQGSELLVSNVYVSKYIKVKKTYACTGSEGPKGCEMSRLAHFLDNRLVDDGEAVSPTNLRIGSALPPPQPKEDFWYSLV
jgi:hypothetical protein